MEYLFYYMLPAPNKIKKQQISNTAQDFFVKTEPQHI